MPVASDGFVYNLIDLLLLFCKPFTSKFADYPQYFSKINCFYLHTDHYIPGASKLEKLDSQTLTALLTPSADVSTLPLTHVT